MARRLHLVPVALFFALLFIYAGARIYNTFQSVATLSDPGWTITQTGGRAVVSRTIPGGPAADLIPGDEVIAINGRRVEARAEDVERPLRRVKPGEDYTIVLLRDGRTLQFTLRAGPLPLSIIVLLHGANVVLPTIFLLTGFGVFLFKPFDKQALLLSLMFGMFIGAIPATVASFGAENLWWTGVVLVVHLVSLFLWPVFFHFFLIFPEPSSLLQRYPRLEFYLYLPHLLTIFPYFAALNVLAAVAPQFEPGYREHFGLIAVISSVLLVGYIAGGFALLLINYRHARRPARRRMRVVVAGSIAGFLPTFVWLGLNFLFDLSYTSPSLSRYLFFAAIFSFPLFPLSFAYAIVRHQVIPIRLILSRGARYLLVSRGFIIIQAIVVFAILSFLLTGSRMAAIDRLGERADIVATMIATAIAIAALTFINQRVMPVIDRRFFREAYDAQQLLSDLTQEMRKVTTVEQLLELAVAKIQHALHTENVTIFLRDNTTGDYVSAISSSHARDSQTSASPDRNLILPAAGAVVARLSQSPLPLAVDAHPSNALSHPADSDTGDLDPRQLERSTIRRSRSALLLPVVTKDALLGIVSLGPRLGDLPYSREDKQLLMMVAWQMAFAIQNAVLVQQITEEERLRHELDIATAVQRRLFPESPPNVERLDLAGVCHPAGGVGGDYYDFIVLDDGVVGIAVADVAGKGISAALLMSTVQASLRSQAPAVNGRLTDLVSSMNELLHRSTDASSYATFFYAQFDQRSGRLTYVNAGHNPPFLVRAGAITRAHGAIHAAATTHGSNAAPTDLHADTSGLSELTSGGPVIGAFQNCSYEQETIELAAGDLLVAYTDGATEALSPSDEEFGESRLRALVAVSTHLSANQISDAIVESIREWCCDRPLHDDLTLVVMKVK